MRSSIRTAVAAALASLLAAGSAKAAGTGEYLQYHEIQVDDSGLMIPWYAPDPAVSYDHVISLVWNWWRNLETCPNGVPYYLQHQVWSPWHDTRGLGGDQVAMALSSWSLLYAYSGDAALIDNMRTLVGFYLARSRSSPAGAWPWLPYPYNTVLHSGVYDGDMVGGVGVLQPDKAASFAAELVTFYEITGTRRYLDDAIGIADTLAARVTPGDETSSPWPYRVHAGTGVVRDAYTTNWTGALRLYDELIRLGEGDTSSYAAARDTVSAWLKAYPRQNNRWGPFFEDVDRWSDTEINAGTFAWYVLEHPEWSGTWQADARSALDWSYSTLPNFGWSRYGAMAINEQTAYPVPGNSHTARHWSLELLYAEKTGDVSRKTDAIRGLNWATYMVDTDGKNRYYQDDIWLTDGYGDYVRHFLRAMGAAPELAPAGASHVLRSSSVVRSVAYGCERVAYSTFDEASREVLRLGFAPAAVRAGASSLPRLDAKADLEIRQGYTYEADGDAAGVLRIRHDAARDVTVTGAGSLPEAATALVFDDDVTLAWGSSPAPPYNLYRGTIAGRAFRYDHACLAAGLAEPRAGDTDVPAPGRGFYYLVAAVAPGCGEGGLGPSPSGGERPVPRACPPSE